MTEKRNCRNCKHLSVIVSQISDYYCSMKNEYLSFSDFKDECIEFEKDELSLREKENKVW